MMQHKAMVILQLLANDRRWWYGLEMVKASDGQLKRGVIYLHLARLEENGLVETRLENEHDHEYRADNPRPRRMYRITKNGIRELSEAEVKKSLHLPKLD
jgi:DNA-binding PadR family transcriptional regulator